MSRKKKGQEQKNDLIHAILSDFTPRQRSNLAKVSLKILKGG